MTPLHDYVCIFHELGKSCVNEVCNMAAMMMLKCSLSASLSLSSKVHQAVDVASVPNSSHPTHFYSKITFGADELSSHHELV